MIYSLALSVKKAVNRSILEKKNILKNQLTAYFGKKRKPVYHHRSCGYGKTCTIAFYRLFSLPDISACLSGENRLSGFLDAFLPLSAFAFLAFFALPQNPITCLSVNEKKPKKSPSPAKIACRFVSLSSAQFGQTDL